MTAHAFSCYGGPRTGRRYSAPKSAADERQALIESIGEMVESMPLSPAQIRSCRNRLERTSLSVLREIWASRDEWHDAIMRGAM